MSMSALTDPWHFPRPDLAQSYLRSFDLGLTSARGLFARRRMGKSEFLKHDLLPAAMHDGYLAAYTNLWDSTDHPGQAVATAREHNTILHDQLETLANATVSLEAMIRIFSTKHLLIGCINAPRPVTSGSSSAGGRRRALHHAQIC